MNCENLNNFRLTNKIQNANERKLMQHYWIELTQMYGTYVDYYTYSYDISSHDFFYGEHPHAPFSGPVPMIMLPQYNGDSLLLSKFGIRTDSDATFIIPILSFRAAFNDNNAEPKSGDLIRLTELGWDRPGGMQDINRIENDTSTCSGYNIATDTLNGLCNNNQTEISYDNCSTKDYYSMYNDASSFQQITRGAPIFEITERRDENLTMNYNMLLGHYVWVLHAKRFDYSYQPNAPREPGSDQVSDSTMYGKLTGGTDFVETPKIYDQTNDKSSKNIWEYDKYPGNNTSIYGNY